MQISLSNKKLATFQRQITNLLSTMHKQDILFKSLKQFSVKAEELWWSVMEYKEALGAGSFYRRIGILQGKKARKQIAGKLLREPLSENLKIILDEHKRMLQEATK